MDPYRRPDQSPAVMYIMDFAEDLGLGFVKRIFYHPPGRRFSSVAQGAFRFSTSVSAPPRN
ncbi:hypothetical protein BC939DRAFT_454795 [Gamsiella multidivaricata]|uniref:uncharacterized protein n=1 Tax=Gamsiella multidivaricata TaxID=101098 RepID=UPI002220EF5D|nr:uncharacterized protein BC939DRAFT_454795 [Gamsiella multidivaricata]KAI7821887.1 hypothetical protein BC939DRAFT_454795 [Gamsiella multidivaricata]